VGYVARLKEEALFLGKNVELEAEKKKWKGKGRIQGEIVTIA
jgi:hypothetical protein